MIDRSEVRYARSGDVSVAYQVATATRSWGTRSPNSNPSRKA